jgi:hypothetical protein
VKEEEVVYVSLPPPEAEEEEHAFEELAKWSTLSRHFASPLSRQWRRRPPKRPEQAAFFRMERAQEEATPQAALQEEAKW